METRDLDIMNQIQTQKERDMEGQPLTPLDTEGTKLAEEKRFTFDLVDIPIDPLR